MLPRRRIVPSQFNAFDRKWRTKWDHEMMLFRDKVVEIEKKTQDFIDHAFRRLRSAEGAFDLLEKFQHIQSRQSIKDQMMEKFDDILGQASKELEVRSHPHAFSSACIVLLR